VNKNIIAWSLSIGLLLSGCGDSEGENRLKTQQMLDSGDYNGVITRVASPSTDDDYMALGVAYMQKAGLGLSELINVISDSSKDEENEAFAAFIKSLSTRSSSSALSDLEKSSEYFRKVVEDCTSIKGDGEKSVCLNIGLVDTMKTATTISYLTNDIEKFGKENDTDSKLKTAACAMEYALSSSSEDCSIRPLSNITFLESQREYTRIEVTYNGEAFEYLLRGEIPSRSSVITKGFCTLESFTSREEKIPESSLAEYFPCPITQTRLEENTDDELTTEKLIVNALNGAVGAIISATGNNDEIKESINEFKCEVLGGVWQSNSCQNANINNEITTQDIIRYLNKQ